MKQFIMFTLITLSIGMITAQSTTTTTAPIVTPTLWDKLKFYGDFRDRVEYDWNNITASNVTNDNRLRMRIRARLGFTYDWNQYVQIGFRLRTGGAVDQQTPHYTLGSAGEFAIIPVGLDRSYIKVNYKGLWAWTGKNTNPFYYQNELFWDENISPEGIAAGYEYKINESAKLKPSVGFFIISSTGKPFDTDKTLKVAQLHFNYAAKKNDINIASGIFSMNNLGEIPDGIGTDTIDYAIVNSSLKYTYKSKIPISIGVDFMKNLSDYSEDSTIVANGFDNATTGYVVNVEVGKLKEKNDWLIGYYYAHIEKFAVVDYFAQDDWERWGFAGASGTRSSNFQGSEIRLGYAFGPKFNILARTYFVEGISPITPTSTIETGNRFRLDLNLAF